MKIAPPHYIDGPHGRIAYRRRDGFGPCVVWLGGFRSDMAGSKAAFLDEWAKHTGRAFLRFDYSGHGESEGVFADGSIGEWFADARCAIDELTDGPAVLVGSSMGGWIATLVARDRPEAVAALVYIAPAPDFTEALMWPAFSDAQRAAIMETGRLETPSAYGDAPDVYTRKLIEDGRRHLVLPGPIPVRAPVRILQGMADADVPWRHAFDFAQALDGDDIEITLVKSGDHRLSSPADLARLRAVLEILPVW